MADKTFRNWIRSVLALPFLPINRIEAAVDRLREEQFDKSSPFSDKMESFKLEFCDYIEDVWLNGNYNPKIWNHWRKTKNLTNNNNEGYNSRINKLISCIHPNPWILLCTLSQELLKAEPDVLWIKDGNPPKQKVTSRYQKLIDKRDDLMAKYAKNQIEEDFYLKRMGAMSLKLARVAHKTTTTVQAQNVPGLVPHDLPGLVPDDDVESNDSLSETRPMPHCKKNHWRSG